MALKKLKSTGKKVKIMGMKTKLERFKVCDQCYGVGTIYDGCVCSYDKYKTIELEFEVCKCCGNLIDDGNPADTLFNEEQIKNHKE